MTKSRNYSFHEYEFRLVVESGTPFRLQDFGSVEQARVVYLKPHFRFKDRTWETKRVASASAVYHDDLWFRWVHSVETPFANWTLATRREFDHHAANFQNPFRVEHRQVVCLDAQAKVYTFRETVDRYRLVFEWEYGSFLEEQRAFDPQLLLAHLSRYKAATDRFKPFDPPPYALDESVARKPVKSDDAYRCERPLYAHKLDGMFGIVYSYPDRIKEKWEDYTRVVRPGMTLGNGLAFAAEKLPDGSVVLLDVYQVRGWATSPWSRESVLTDFLSRLAFQLPEGYFCQSYVRHPSDLSPTSPFPTDGWILHDVQTDVVVKRKPARSIDLVHHGGYFYFEEGRIPASGDLEEGAVYEVSARDGTVLRKRPDRFRSNTLEQIRRELQGGWGGPPVEALLPVQNKKKPCARRAL